jgi:predicted Fe-Mo cluster-binding NifX family protein
LTDRIVIPSEDQNGLNASLAEHFGRAPYYTVVDFDEKGEVSNVKAVPNVSEHAGGVGVAPDHILELKPTAVIVYDMGFRAIDIFKNAGVAVLRANANTVDKVVAAYKDDKLQELTEGCGHEQHEHNEHHH